MPALLEVLRQLPPAARNALRTDAEHALVEKALEADLAEFARSAWHVLEPATPCLWNWHMDVICAYLEAFRRREIRRLIINVPPGTTKSLLASVMYPAWIWTTDPGHRFLCGSNEDAIATRDSMRMRRLVESDWYQERWGKRMQIRLDQREKTLFENSATGFRQSQGVRAMVTGKRGDTVIWDDPHDASRVESDVQRQAVLDAWDQGWSFRLNEPARSGILLIMQRVHSLDMTGHVMTKSDQGWVRLAIPMRYETGPDAVSYDPGADLGRPDLADPRREEGELLFPARFPQETVRDMETDLGSAGTAGQLQQRPAARGGGEFRREWLRRYRSPPPKDGTNYLILVDPAGERKPGQRGKKDHTAIGVIGLRDDQNLYVVDLHRDRLGLTERTALLFELHRKYRPYFVGYESYGKDSDIAHITDVMERDHYRFAITELGGLVAKNDRIRALLPWWEEGRIWLPESMHRTLADKRVVDIIALFIDEEYLPFPVGPYDDMLDMLARLKDAAVPLRFPAGVTASQLRTTPGGAGRPSRDWQRD